MSDKLFRHPSITDRAAFMGRTGSGKTRAAAWFLSEAPFDKQPYVIVDYKVDDFLNAIPHIREIGLHEVPKHPGLYITHPQPDEDDDAVENWLREIWRRENIGLYFDEAYMLPKGSPSFNSILTQGRSKHIPAIVLTQRPSWISRFVFSEANKLAIFHLNDADDRKQVKRFVPVDLEKRLPEYHFHWFDVDQNQVFHLTPVPDSDVVLSRFEERLKPKRKTL